MTTRTDEEIIKEVKQLIESHVKPGVAQHGGNIEFLNYNMVPIEDLIGKGKDQITMDLVPLDKISYYAAEDADIVFQLAEIFAPKLEENGQLNFFADIEMPLIDVLMKMENEGVYVDEDLLNEMSLISKFPFLALSAILDNSIFNSLIVLFWQFFIIGTTNPFLVSTATPILTYFFKIIASCVSFKELFKLGNSLKAWVITFI